MTYEKALVGLLIWQQHNKTKLNMFDCSEILSYIFPVTRAQALDDLTKYKQMSGKLKKV